MNTLMFKQIKCAAYQVWMTAMSNPIRTLHLQGENYETVFLDGDAMIHPVSLCHKLVCED